MKMERSVALNKLRKLLGKDFGYRIDSKACTREEREAAREQLPASNKERSDLEEKRRQRQQFLLDNDKEYQEINAARVAAVKRSQELLGKLHSSKITVGNSVAGLFFSVKAEGDNWEEVIAKLTK
jgi:hypothetical protein